MQKRNVLRNLCLITMLSAAVAVGLNCLILFINLAQFSERYQQASAILYSPPFWQQIVYNGIVVPIVEELLFRGALFRVLRRWISFPWAMIISAVVFGVYHGNLVQFVYAVICGMLLAYLYEKYDSILAPILSHMTMNLVSIILTQTGVFAWIMESNVIVPVVAMLCGAIGIVMFRAIQKMDVTKVLKLYCKDKGDVI